MRRKWLFIAVAAVLAGAGAHSLYRKIHSPARARQADRRAPATGPEVTLSGKLRPQHVTPVGPEEEGDLDAFLVDVGDEVYQGQVLARIGSSGMDSQRDAASAALSVAEAQVLRAETAVASARVEASRTEGDQQRARAALEKARAYWERQQTLHNAGATPRIAWEAAQRDYQSAQKEFDIMDQAARLSADQVNSALNALAAARQELADRQRQVAAAQGNLDASELHSPVDGMVIARNGEPGKPAGVELFDIATDMFALETLLDAEPQVLRLLHPGQPALVVMPDLQNAAINGEVKEIQATQVLVQFNCTLAAIRPGMRVDVHLKLQ